MEEPIAQGTLIRREGEGPRTTSGPLQNTTRATGLTC